MLPQAGKEPAVDNDELLSGPEMLEYELLSIGGTRVVQPPSDDEALWLLDEGLVFSQKVRMRKGQRSNCHENSVRLWASDPEKCQLCTGYALSSDGVWRSHSWVVSGHVLYETTVKRDYYFGVVEDPVNAAGIWAATVFQEDYADGNVPQDFWRTHAPLVALLIKDHADCEAETGVTDGLEALTVNPQLEATPFTHCPLCGANPADPEVRCRVGKCTCCDELMWRCSRTGLSCSVG